MSDQYFGERFDISENIDSPDEDVNSPCRKFRSFCRQGSGGCGNSFRDADGRDRGCRWPDR